MNSKRGIKYSTNLFDTMHFHGDELTALLCWRDGIIIGRHVDTLAMSTANTDI
jgi:hypothetical protein